MRTVLIVSAFLALPILGGCHAAIWGNLALLAISVGIFMGTLSLGRSA